MVDGVRCYSYLIFQRNAIKQLIYDRISDQQPSLSEFEDEAEVLILPWTLFRVDSIEKESSSPSSYTICLTSIILPHKNMLSFVGMGIETS